MRERRKSPRSKRYFLGTIQAKNRKITITVKNLSLEGMGITLDEDLLVGSDITVTLLHKFSHRAYGAENIDLTIPATVVWARKLADRGSLKDIDDNAPYEDTETEFEAGLQLKFPSEGIQAQYESLLDKIIEEDRNDQIRLNE